ncbi:hypothetical protein [Hymenobacter sp. BT559]|uniref:hypothetical protein n=1 Tax=Hymenobacter sp. BT559 TaxID=2795729 RepID=UPI0018EC95D9|nr:hypothetical protein [Hymenobacter sp. BT559]MBJ6143373.1 hypothetical protein [Hymenobacter sp. BT559]
MKILPLLASASIALLTMSFSCDKQDSEVQPCNEATTAVATQAYTLPTGCSLTAQRGQSKSYIIDSPDELAAAVQCNSSTAPTVDFTTSTLLAGRVPRSGGAFLRSQQVALDCQGNYVHTVNVSDSPTLSPVDVDYTIVVPKLPSGKQVKVVVNIVQ